MFSDLPADIGVATDKNRITVVGNQAAILAVAHRLAVQFVWVRLIYGCSKPLPHKGHCVPRAVPHETKAFPLQRAKRLSTVAECSGQPG